MSILGYCPNCEKEGDIEVVRKEEEFNIRGELIPVMVEYYHCNECGEDFESGAQEYDPIEVAYREYRKRKGFVQPEEMRAFRKSLKLTQKEMSDVFGIGVATLNRYENGALQSDAHDQIIRLLMDPINLLRLANDNSKDFSEEIRDKIRNRYKQENDDYNDLLDNAIVRYGSYKPDISSGYVRFDINKLFQMIKFFCNDIPVVKTKLTKLCFYADFKHFKEYGISITGAHYAHAPHGPVPDQFDTWLTAMAAWNNEIIVEEKIFGEYPGEEYYSPNVDLSGFSPSEILIINIVRDHFKSFSATKIREFSHQEKGYLATEDGECISYEYGKELMI